MGRKTEDNLNLEDKRFGAQPCRAAKAHEVLHYIDQLRVERNITVDEFCEKLGYSSRWYLVCLQQRRWARGLAVIDKMLAVFGYELSVKKVAKS